MANLLVFGAGASFGSDSVGVPPLGDGLFEALRSFDPKAWGALPSELARKFDGDFERGMQLVSDQYSEARGPLQRAMAAYFFRFEPQPSSLYVALARRIKQNGWRGAIVTLNYERLLELSLLSTGLRPRVGNAPGGPSELELCLPHGCCHLFCRHVRTSGKVLFRGNMSTGGRVEVIADRAAFDSRIRGDAFPPVMSYFEPSKSTTSGADFIHRQRARFAELVSAAERIVIVGLRPQPRDRHIWLPFAQTSAELIYCGGRRGASEFAAWARSVERTHDRTAPGHFAKAFEELCCEAGL